MQAALQAHQQLVRQLLDTPYVDLWCDGPNLFANDPFEFNARGRAESRVPPAPLSPFLQIAEPHNRTAELLRLAWLASA